MLEQWSLSVPEPRPPSVFELLAWSCQDGAVVAVEAVQDGAVVVVAGDVGGALPGVLPVVEP